MDYDFNRKLALRLAVEDFTAGMDDDTEEGDADLQLAKDIAKVEQGFRCPGFHVFVVNVDDTYYMFTFEPQSHSMRVWYE